MAEYIERSAAIEAAKHAWAKGLEPSQYIEALPAADVAPIEALERLRDELYAQDFKAALRETEPELSDALVPNCVYRCGCPEMKSCGLWARMTRETGELIASQCINERYKAYNAYFYGRRKETERAAE